jgi:hypothetical protein
MGEAQIVTILRATRAHAEYVAGNIYNADRYELEATGLSAYAGVMVSFEESSHVWAAVSEEGVICIWGVCRSTSLLGGVNPWLITSTLIDKYAKHFLRGARAVLRDMVGECGYLETFVDSRHTRALRFLEWLGFNMSEGLLVGAHGVPFHRFSLRY